MEEALHGIDQPIWYDHRETTIRAEVSGRHGTHFRVWSISLGSANVERCYASLWGEPGGASTSFRISRKDYDDLIALGAKVDGQDL